MAAAELEGIDEEPRIAPGSAKDVGWVNAGIIAVATKMIGAGSPPNVFTTLARHRRLFRIWVRFGRALMLKGELGRSDTELLILRAAHNASSAYEWHHHERVALECGLTREDVERVRRGPDADGWTPHRATMLRATDELQRDLKISTPVWDDLSAFLSESQLIELCMLVGHYTTVAMTLNSLQVQIDPE